LPIWEGTTNILSLDFAQEIFKNFSANIEILKILLTLPKSKEGDFRLNSL